MNPNNKINFLQINLHRSKKAHNILDQYTKDKDIDIVLMSEQNKKIAETRNYPRDANNDAAIWIRTSKVRISGIQREHGYVCVFTESTLIISAYISPNVPIQSYKDTLFSICETLNQHRCLQWIVVGDLNAKSTVWGNVTTDDRGDILLETIASKGLCLLNEGNTPSFVRRDQTSIPDISLCSEAMEIDVTSIPLFTTEELVNASSRMKNKTAPGPDGIAAEIVKSAVLSCPDQVLSVFNNALRDGEFPTAWKKAVVVLIPKPEGKEAPCLLITLDIKNAFNSASWTQIIESLKAKNISPYMIRLLMSYFNSRNIISSSGTTIETSAGIPQGSVAAPVLWNCLYDGVFDLPFQPGVFLTAYADDLAVSVLAPEKSEAVLLIGRKRCGPIHIHIDGKEIVTKERVKYLGVILDQQMTFGPHVAHVADKATTRANALIRLMPRHGGATWEKRKLLNYVVESTILYAAPVWKDTVNVKTHMSKLEKIQRRMTLGITRAYRTTSTPALQVLACVIPIDLMVLERHKTFGLNEEDKQRERDETLRLWNERWNRETRGPWTRRLMPDIRQWVTRQHGNVTYYIAQALSNHGCFTSYLHRFKRANSPSCRYCSQEDTAEHTLFECTEWTQQRETANHKLGIRLSVRNLISTMLENEEKWNIIATAISSIMKRKETDNGRTRPTTGT
ncbi:hypothetical protein WDU94_003785 [Cyamophila willieti]